MVASKNALEDQNKKQQEYFENLLMRAIFHLFICQNKATFFIFHQMREFLKDPLALESF